MTHIDFKDYINDLKSAPYGEKIDKKVRSICDKDYYLVINCSYNKCAEKEIISGLINCYLDEDCIGRRGSGHGYVDFSIDIEDKIIAKFRIEVFDKYREGIGSCLMYTLVDVIKSVKNTTDAATLRGWLSEADARRGLREAATKFYKSFGERAKIQYHFEDETHTPYHAPGIDYINDSNSDGYIVYSI